MQLRFIGAPFFSQGAVLLPLAQASPSWLTKPTKCHVDIWQFSRVAWQKPLTRVKANTSTAAASAQRKQFFQWFFHDIAKICKIPSTRQRSGGRWRWLGGKLGGGLYMIRFWLAAHTFFPSTGCQRNPWPAARARTRARAKGAGLSPCCPFAKMFLLEFYFISLDFDGFIVCPGLRCNGVTAASLLWLPSRSDAGEMRMQISLWLLRGFWQMPQIMGWYVLFAWGGGSGRVGGDRWRFVCCYKNYTRTLHAVHSLTFTANEVNCCHLSWVWGKELEELRGDKTVALTCTARFCCDSAWKWRHMSRNSWDFSPVNFSRDLKNVKWRIQ